MTEKNNRIKILDSFRFLAIISVMVFHFYSTASSKKYYSFNEKWDNSFNLGFLGVYFFFIISGFVISYTLFKTKDFKTFVIKRVVRLLPAMLICSLITFIVGSFLDIKNFFPDGKVLSNILFSWSFISPSLINILAFKGNNFAYVDGSYWSLWVEIQFYLLCSLIYFSDEKRFFKNFTITAFLIYLTHRLIQNINTSNIFHIHSKLIFTIYEKIFWSGFNLPEFILLFLIGVIFYNLYIDKKNLKSIFNLLLASSLQFVFMHQTQFRLAFILMILLFVLFIYLPHLLNFLTWKPLTNIGLASYALYLIHQNIGNILIYRFNYLFGRFNFLFPIVVLLFLLIFANFFYKCIEKPIGKKLLQLFN